MSFIRVLQLQRIIRPKDHGFRWRGPTGRDQHVSDGDFHFYIVKKINLIKYYSLANLLIDTFIRCGNEIPRDFPTRDFSHDGLIPL